MVNKKYSMAMAETLHYLKGINQMDINKIPNKFIEFLKNNADKDYECNFDYTKPLKELELMDETRGLISMICLNYICENEEQKKAYINHLKENEKHYQEELRKKYNPDDIFKNNKVQKVEEKPQEIENNLPVEVKKEKFWEKIVNFFKRIFNINR